MSQLRALFIMLLGLACAGGCRPEEDSTNVQGLSAKTVLDLGDVKDNPGGYGWFDFRPNVQKLILSGAAETEHIAILWYTDKAGGVGLHRHSKTESVYVIEGSQTDAKGVYPTGTVYFNPPGSGHQITNSSGFFILAYASPPDFTNTRLIEEYTPIRIDTKAPDFMHEHPFDEQGGMRSFAVPVDSSGGLSSKFIEVTSAEDRYLYGGNYLLVLDGNCVIEGVPLGQRTLVVTKTVQPEPFTLTAAKGSTCLALGVSF